jgi:hypothetical protein
MTADKPTCHVDGCEAPARYEVLLYDRYRDGTEFREQDFTCPFLCKEHKQENERGMRGTKAPRHSPVYPFTNKHGAQGFTEYVRIHSAR